MGVYIKGIEMPMGGRILIVFPSGRVSEVSADATQNIFKETQAISVSPHGRLGDLDALESIVFESLKNAITDYNSTFFGKALCTFIAESIVDEIEAAPTVIPAEKGEI